jgi:hypothetical protein
MAVDIIATNFLADTQPCIIGNLPTSFDKEQHHQLAGTTRRSNNISSPTSVSTSPSSLSLLKESDLKSMSMTTYRTPPSYDRTKEGSKYTASTVDDLTTCADDSFSCSSSNHGDDFNEGNEENGMAVETQQQQQSIQEQDMHSLESLADVSSSSSSSSHFNIYQQRRDEILKSFPKLLSDTLTTMNTANERLHGLDKQIVFAGCREVTELQNSVKDAFQERGGKNRNMSCCLRYCEPHGTM